jgi:hypothetical protein
MSDWDRAPDGTVKEAINEAPAPIAPEADSDTS